MDTVMAHAEMSLLVAVTERLVACSYKLGADGRNQKYRLAN